MTNTRKLLIILAALSLSAALLCGCAARVEIGGEKYPADSESLSLVLEAGELPLLDSFTSLKSLSLSGSRCYDEIDAWAAAHPSVELSYTLLFPDGREVLNTAEELALGELKKEQLAEAAALVSHMPALRLIDIGSGLEAGDAALIAAACPGAELRGEFSLMGKKLGMDEEGLELSGITHQDAQALLPLLPHMKALKSIELGSDRVSSLSWDDIYAMEQSCPQAEFSFDFTIYQNNFSLNDSVMDLNHIDMTDEGKLVASVTRCMPKLSYLDMDSCGVSNEAMAVIRDSLPNAQVVWRIWFADNYSVRTDVERILASNPGLGGDIMGDNADSLKYCTKVKYLDIGHNDFMTDISFVSSMPDLEVLIIALSRVSDLRPLESCQKLDYLEVQLTAVNDLRPLSSIKSLRHLNIGYCYALKDISPLFELPELERVWIGQYVPIPPEQVNMLREAAPGCDVNTSIREYENWRYTGNWINGAPEVCPRYLLLRNQMQYGLAPSSYAYYWNDPLYNGKPEDGQ